jgi:protein-S-isoprenylcysteine O-methyltransferase Ste14
MPATLYLRLLGLLIGVGGMVLALAGVQNFRRAKTSRVPIRPAAVLVTSGSYALSRNPMYVGLALATIGCGLLMATWWPILLLIPALAIVQMFVIVPEERYLRRRFGVDYDHYVDRVHRWL